MGADKKEVSEFFFLVHVCVSAQRFGGVELNHVSSLDAFFWGGFLVHYVPERGGVIYMVLAKEFEIK